MKRYTNKQLADMCMRTCIYENEESYYISYELLKARKQLVAAREMAGWIEAQGWSCSRELTNSSTKFREAQKWRPSANSTL